MLLGLQRPFVRYLVVNCRLIDFNLLLLNNLPLRLLLLALLVDSHAEIDGRLPYCILLLPQINGWLRLHIVSIMPVGFYAVHHGSLFVHEILENLLSGAALSCFSPFKIVFLLFLNR